MIPLQLYIKNFLSYGDQPQIVNFEPYHLICLAGKNGHGKSAMLDALTWVVWGYARKVQSVAKADEHLVRLGASDMMVALDFMSNGIKYRVRRELSLHKTKNTARLDFGILDPETSKFRSLTEKTIRETQDVIIAAIGLTHDVFENSAFLRQGQSHEFSRKSPKERKELLASMIGATEYELLRKRALEHNRDAQINKAQAEKTCELLAAELSQEQEARERHEALRLEERTLGTTTKSHQEQIARLAHANHTLATQLAAITQQIATLDELHTRVADARAKFMATALLQRTGQRDLRRLRAQHISPEQLASMTEQLRIAQSAIAEKVATQQQCIALEQLLNRKIAELESQYLREQVTLERARGDFEAARTRLQHTRDQDIQQHTMLAARESALTAKIHLVQVRIATQICSNGDLDTAQTLLDKERSRAYRLQARLDEYRMRAQLDHLNRPPETSIDHEACPECGQKIMQELQQAYRSRCIRRRQRCTRHMARYERCHAAALQRAEHATRHMTMLHEVRQAHEQEKRDLTTLKVELDHLRQLQQASIERTTRAQQEIDALTQPPSQVMQSLADTIEQRTDIQELKTQLTAARAQTDGLHHAHEQHRLLSQALAEAHALMTTQARLIAEQSHRTQRLTLMQELKQSIRTHRSTLVDLSKLHRQHQDCMEGVTRNDADITRLQALLSETVLRQQELLVSRGALEQTLQHYERQKTILKREQNRCEELAKNIHVYTSLALALSKDGIQGMLIERVLPEIEMDANVLLGRLTDNQTHIYLESLRELKSGSSKETLEIKIADAHGLRPYEMFSGGEAFRIDFALRLAIAQFLARRSGASIQTLIIDEGFGSQDEEGISHIMESIYAIQDAFAKIIIVSHLPIMKDQFPVHFQVKKQPHGSTIRIVEQG